MITALHLHLPERSLPAMFQNILFGYSETLAGDTPGPGKGSKISAGGDFALCEHAFGMAYSMLSLVSMSHSRTASFPYRIYTPHKFAFSKNPSPCHTAFCQYTKRPGTSPIKRKVSRHPSLIDSLFPHADYP